MRRHRASRSQREAPQAGRRLRGPGSAPRPRESFTRLPGVALLCATAGVALAEDGAERAGTLARSTRGLDDALIARTGSLRQTLRSWLDVTAEYAKRFRDYRIAASNGGPRENAGSLESRGAGSHRSSLPALTVAIGRRTGDIMVPHRVLDRSARQ